MAHSPPFDMFGPMPFSMADTISNDPHDPMPAMVTTEWVDTLPDEVIDIVVNATTPTGDANRSCCSPRSATPAARFASSAVDAVNRAGRSDEFLIGVGGLVTSPEAGIVLEAALRHTRPIVSRRM